MKSIIIAGGDGFIGSHLTRHFIENGYEVCAITIPNSPTKGRLSGLEHVSIVEGDLYNYKELIPALPQNPAAVFNFA